MTKKSVFICLLPVILLVNYVLLARDYDQSITDPTTQSLYVMDTGFAGFDDMSWSISKVPPTLLSRVKHLFVGTNREHLLFEQVSEASFDEASPNLFLEKSRYLVFERGGLYHALYDTHESKVLINEVCPWCQFEYENDESGALTDLSRKSQEYKQAFRDWKLARFHNPIKSILADRDS